MQLKSKCYRVRDVLTNFYSRSLNFSITCPLAARYSNGTALLPLIFRCLSLLPDSWHNISSICPKSCPIMLLYEISRCFIYGKFIRASERPGIESFENIDTLLNTSVCKHINFEGFWLT
jgi:hypothetical protein